MNPNNSTTWRQFLVRAGTAAALTALVMQPLAALAQSGAPWPTRPLRIIAGYPSGSSPDLLARLLAEHLGKSLGQSVIVENKPGASGNIGAKGINIEVWNAIMAPVKMPEAHQARLNAEIAKILQTKEVREKLLQLGWKVEDTSRKALADRIKSDTALYGALITAKGIKLD